MPANDTRWLVAILAICILVSLLFAIAMWQLTGGHLMVPLDDTFIHLQYAKQLARGHFFVYSPQDSYSTGATSLIYPFLFIPFFWLGLKAVQLLVVSYALGMACVLASAVILYFWGALVVNRLVGAFAALLFLTNGNLMWVYLSGMETGLFATLMLATLYCFTRWWMSNHDKRLVSLSVSPLDSSDRKQESAAGQTITGSDSSQVLRRSSRGFSLALILLAITSITRPEGLVLAIISLFFFVIWFRRAMISRAQLAWGCATLLPNACYLLCNKFLTGTFTTNGMLSKSVLNNPYFNVWDMVRQMSDAFIGIWAGYLVNLLGDFPYIFFKELIIYPYLPPFALLLALFGLVPLLSREWRTQGPGVYLLSAMWFFLGLSSTCVVEAGFVHSQRYHLPYLPLLLLFAVVGLYTLTSLSKEHARDICIGAGALLIFFSAPSLLYWAEEYGENANDIFNQHRRMSWWVNDATPPDAIIGLTDAGLIPYYTNRPIYDFVGLMTNNQALHWRNGVGSTFERIERLAPEQRPDYIITYPYLWGEEHFLGKPVYQITLLKNTVTSGKDLVVFQQDWSALNSGDRMWQSHLAKPTNRQTDLTDRVVDSLDVADLESEREHGYRHWDDSERRPYLPWPYRGNLFRKLKYPREASHVEGAAPTHLSQEVWDGGRAITGGEEFRIDIFPGKALTIVMRTDAPQPVSLRVSLNRKPVGEWNISATPQGEWQEPEFVIPAEYVPNASKAIIRLEFIWHHVVEQAHRPFHYWFIQTPGGA
jgi:hypothetical protein